MIRLRLTQLAKEKGIKHLHTALVDAGITSKVANEYKQGYKERLVMEDIEIMCLVFRCTPNELFEIVPDTPATADLTQPVYKECVPRPDFDLLAVTKHMTPEEIKKLFEERGKNGE